MTRSQAHARVTPEVDVTASTTASTSVTHSHKNTTFDYQYALVNKLGKSRFAALATDTLRTEAATVGAGYMERLRLMSVREARWW